MILKIYLAKNQIYREKTKHIDVCEGSDCKRKEILENVRTDDNSADVLTKSLPKLEFKHCLKILHVL